MRVILIIEIENLRILYFVNVKSPQITNSRKSKHAKITRSTIYMVNLPSAEYTRLPNTHVSRLPSASAEYTNLTKPCQSASFNYQFTVMAEICGLCVVESSMSGRGTKGSLTTVD